jgi:hypothetical protein
MLLFSKDFKLNISSQIMKNLLTFSSIIEFSTGLVLLILPSLLTNILFTETLDTPILLTVERVAGAALLALSAACWFARNEGHSLAARGVVSAMLLYNVSVSLVLIYTSIGLSLSGFALWPVVLIHIAMSVWCIINLLPARQSQQK